METAVTDEEMVKFAKGKKEKWEEWSGENLKKTQ